MSQEFELSPGERRALLIILLIGVIGIILIGIKNSSPRHYSRSKPSFLVVQIEGAVRQPGVYYLPLGTRMGEAIMRAGGALEGADLSKMNLASPLKDGQKIHVPYMPSFPYPSQGYHPQQTSPHYGKIPSSPQHVININTATLQELASLPGVGEKLAQEIITIRSQKGGFSSVEELLLVPGIGEKRLERIRPFIEAR